VLEVGGATYVFPSKAIYIETGSSVPQAEYPLPIGVDNYNLRISARGVDYPDRYEYASRSVNIPAEVTANPVTVVLDGIITRSILSGPAATKRPRTNNSLTVSVDLVTR